MTSRAGPYVVPPGGTRLAGAILPFKAVSDETDGALSICEFELGPWQSGPVLHVHDATDEGFYVLAGTLEAQLGDERVRAAEGAFVWVPRGTAHAFANGGPDQLRVLSLVLPGGIERLFLEQAAYVGALTGPPDENVLHEMGERHGARTLGPPIRAAGATSPPEPSGYGVEPGASG